MLTGLSGAGKSTAAGLLEDLGFFCIDNVPANLGMEIFKMLTYSAIEKAAFVIDLRSTEFGNDNITESIKLLKSNQNGIKVKVVFLMASEPEIIRRFGLTRRAHPLIKKAGGLEDAVKLEKDKMKDIMEISDFVIDTSKMNSHQLREKLKSLIERESKFFVRIVSFGFKHGIPMDLDFIFDVRFFPNPYYIGNMRFHTGKDEDVKEFLRSTKGVKEFLDKLVDITEFASRMYSNEGRMEINIGIGCTGGRHRSVFFAEEMADSLSKKGYNVASEHRDIDLE